MKFAHCWSKIRLIRVRIIFEIVSVRLKRQFTVNIAHWDRRKCPLYGGVRLTVVHITEVFLLERHLSSFKTCECVRFREISYWMSVLRGFTLYRNSFRRGATASVADSCGASRNKFSAYNCLNCFFASCALGDCSL